MTHSGQSLRASLAIWCRTAGDYSPVRSLRCRDYQKWLGLVSSPTAGKGLCRTCTSQISGNLGRRNCCWNGSRVSVFSYLADDPRVAVPAQATVEDALRLRGTRVGMGAPQQADSALGEVLHAHCSPDPRFAKMACPDCGSIFSRSRASVAANTPTNPRHSTRRVANWKKANGRCLCNVERYGAGKS